LLEHFDRRAIVALVALRVDGQVAAPGLGFFTAPASSVSPTWSSKESSSLVTHAIPPCAQAVLESTPLRFVITATEPFGGYKQSGIGRELGDYGYNEYRQIKHVWQNTATDRSGYMHFAALSGNI